MSKLPTKMPDDWGWEVHNTYTHEKKKKQFAEIGAISPAAQDL